MTQASIDVVGIGNAIVDVIAHSEDEFLAREGLVKGTMTLIDAGRADALYRIMGPAIEASGGSAGNTMAGVASLGGAGAYIGKVRDDFLGQVYRHDITAAGVRFETPAATHGPGTARCLILVTPDGQRTMNTYLGACVELGPADIDPDVIAAAQVTYLEGYLFDPPQAQEAFRKAAAIAHSAGRQVALSLSDPFCVGRHRAAFRDLVDGHVDILFANEAEICSLYETDDFVGQRDIGGRSRASDRGGAGRARRRHHRGRRSLRQRLPLRPGPRPAASRLRRDRQLVRCRNHRPLRRPSRCQAFRAGRESGPRLTPSHCGQKVSTQGRSSTSNDQALRGWRNTSR
jgi:sugar/nucleoside kinase (ribokinase family)